MRPKFYYVFQIKVIKIKYNFNGKMIEKPKTNHCILFMSNNSCIIAMLA